MTAVAPRTTPLPVLTPQHLVPAEQPTIHFLGVSTGSSSIQRVFPAWAAALGLDDAVLQGVDLPVGAPAADVRRLVEFVAGDPLAAGMQITSHKVAVSQAAGDLFAVRRPLATLMDEISLVTKEEDGLHGFAKDPLTGELALDAIVPDGYWAETGASAVLLGAGGAGTALAWCLARPERGSQRPAELVVTDRDERRLQHLAELVRAIGSDVPLRLVHVEAAADADEVVAGQPVGSLVVNATGLGKDLPGSPLGADAVLPERAIAWDLNYRGDLEFLGTAGGQADRGVRIEDGWTYFVHGWLQAVREVFHVDVPTAGPEFDRLSAIAREVR
ncbi:shikimate dehydrogenase [Amnibacterium endophyticum]|uniref:Shikimate dehydrogenase n=1 Tax=Amnibacterium endophyticum TaxID=2109337 RepID=A0ABW4LB64_9MICO